MALERKDTRLISASVIAALYAVGLPAQRARAADAAVAAGDLEEIVVTASRRETSILDLPYNIAAVSGAQLEQAGIGALADLARYVPGVAYVDRGDRNAGLNNNFIIRGLNADAESLNPNPNFAAPTVSSYVDETPLFVNLTLRDIERVEVLRGPQGTLYGDGSIGGTIRFLFNKPDTTKYSATVTGSGSWTDHAGSPNGSVDGIINVPISDTLAVRAYVGYERKAGFVDAPELTALDKSGVPVLANPGDIAGSPSVTYSKNDINDSRSLFGRVAALFKPSDSLSLELAYIHQHVNAGDEQVDNPNFGSHQPFIKYSSLLEPLKRDVDVVSLEAQVDFGFASLTSASSYSRDDSKFSRDLTGLYTVGLSALYGAYPRFTVLEANSTHDARLTQELRLVSQKGDRIEWLVGGFFSRHNATFTADDTILGYSAWANASGYQPGLATDQAYTLDREGALKDRALFGELTLKPLSRLDVTLGGRAFWQDFSQTVSQTLPICGMFCGDGPLGTVNAAGKNSFHNHISKVNLSYKLRDDLRVYATRSEGFRNGGGNALPLSGPFAVPPSYLTFQPDKVVNYEIGAKGRLWDRFSFSGAFFYINWRNFQFDTFTPGGFPMVFNGAAARSKGVEFETSGKITDHWQISLGYTYVQARVTEPFTFGQLQAMPGDPLPGAPRHLANISASYQAPLTDRWSLIGNVRGYYQSASFSSFNPTDADFYLPLPAYNLWNGSIGIQDEHWTTSLFIDNLTNKRAVFAAQTNVQYGDRYRVQFINRPLTAGIRVSYAF